MKAKSASSVLIFGASGAIAGVLAAYLRLFPRARILTWIFFIFAVEIPAWVFILLWFGLQVLSGLATVGAGVNSGVAFWAHIGGFVAGLMLTGMFAAMPPKPQRPRVLEMRME